MRAAFLVAVSLAVSLGADSKAALPPGAAGGRNDGLGTGTEEVLPTEDVPSPIDRRWEVALGAALDVEVIDVALDVVAVGAAAMVPPKPAPSMSRSPELCVLPKLLRNEDEEVNVAGRAGGVGATVAALEVAKGSDEVEVLGRKSSSGKPLLVLEAAKDVEMLAAAGAPKNGSAKVVVAAKPSPAA